MTTMVTITFDLDDHVKPAVVRGQIKSLRAWRRNRDAKDLPCGDLDMSILHLERYEQLLTEGLRVESHYKAARQGVK